MVKQDVIEVEATVIAALPNAMFRLKLPSEQGDHEILGLISARVSPFIRLLVLLASLMLNMAGKRCLGIQRNAFSVKVLPASIRTVFVSFEEETEGS